MAKWVKIHSGHYKYGQFEVIQQLNDQGKLMWYCYHNNTLFDIASSITQAKRYCKELV